ncbi:hypothetical protein Vretimale_11856 [Volvox reticuliferus]|uniref:Glycosyl transferase CAP10 domain-containing protein n=3 Tax=Volvox reticuliferus TaxID=1737510 RepID=A0A8J4CL97_9CHLO|nr:hypothetical protein Vretifemale_11400 [Volvox reticuliferus]GIM07780.1 hypothetical protein Vretimale_11856 [Volvox reticuliferus]
MQLLGLDSLAVVLFVLAAAVAQDASASGTCMGDCDLHPSLLERVRKDVAWLDEAGGITDAMIRNISLVCDAKIKHQCNVKAVRMMIKDGEIYLNSLHPDWRLGPPELLGFLLELYETSKMYRLPDLEFAYNGDDDASSPIFDWIDRSSLRVTFHGGPFPLLAWSKSNKSMVQLVPYSGAFRCTDDSFDNLLARLDEIRRVAWPEKRTVAFGRWNEFCAQYMYEMPTLPSGESFICPRQWLPTLSEQHHEVMDVGAMGGTLRGQRVSAVPLMHQNAYKYLVSTDGWAISSKFDKYLLLGSTIIKAQSSRYGFYYDALRQDEHYVAAMNTSRDDILGVIEWLKSHDVEAERMAVATQQFAVRHLHRNARLCYYRTLMTELGKRMRFTPDCSQRKLCLPLGRFLDYLTTKRETAHACRYQEVLVRYGTGRGTPAYDSFSDEAIKELLADPKYWPRDTDIPPLPNEPYFPGAPRRLRRR